MHKDQIEQVFRFFTEVGIIQQLGSTLIERHLPDRLTHQHFGLLGHLSRRPEGSTPLQLAHAFQIPKTSMTHMIRVMEDLDLIEIRPNPADARSKLAGVTAKGLDLLQGTLVAAAKDVSEMQPAMDLDKVGDSLPLLEAIRIQLDAARDG